MAAAAAAAAAVADVVAMPMAAKQQQTMAATATANTEDEDEEPAAALEVRVVRDERKWELWWCGEGGICCVVCLTEAKANKNISVFRCVRYVERRGEGRLMIGRTERGWLQICRILNSPARAG